MELNSNSWQAKLYKWYFRRSLPNNICAYFWMLVVLYISIIPYCIIALPEIIARTRKADCTDEFAERLGIGFLLHCGLLVVFCVLCPIGLLWMKYPKHDGFYENCLFIGYLIDIILIIIGVGALVKAYLRRKKNHKKKPSLIVEWVKAKKGKYCTPITWK